MSQINYVDIDGEFPRAGIDNSSQGFRDNFTVIRNSLQTAKEEITELETITAKTNTSNDFNNNSVTSLVVGNWAQKAYNRTVAAEPFQIVDIGLIPAEDVPTNTSAGGNYQQFFVDGNTTFSLQGWYNPGLCSLRLAVYLDGTIASHVIEFASQAPGGNGTIYYDSATNWPDALLIEREADEPTRVFKIFEFWSIDGGVNVFCKYLGRYTTI
jgi:hypothetical protein